MVTKKKVKVTFLVTLLLVICLSIIYVLINLNDSIRKNNVGGRVCDMFISDGQLNYIDFNQTLYRYDNTTGHGKKLSKINIMSGSSIIYNGNYIYYSNGNSISRSNMNGTSQVQLIKGDNIYVDAVDGDRLFYHKAYKSSDNGFSNFEYRVYEIKDSTDTMLISKSEDMWNILSVYKDIIFADFSSKTDSGLYSFNIQDKTKKKLSEKRTYLGLILGDKFYYSTEDKRDLWSINLQDGRSEKIPITPLVQRFTAFGNYLYIADSESRILSYNVKTQKTQILAKDLGSVWNLCTDGKNLFSYDTKSPEDKIGNITVITVN